MADSEFIEGTNMRTDGTWTTFKHTTRTGHGTIAFDPDVKAGSVFAMRLRNAIDPFQVFSDTVVWECDEDGRKTLATDVIPGTKYHIEARSSDGATRFTGRLFTHG